MGEKERRKNGWKIRWMERMGGKQGGMSRWVGKGG